MLSPKGSFSFSLSDDPSSLRRSSRKNVVSSNVKVSLENEKEDSECEIALSCRTSRFGRNCSMKEVSTMRRFGKHGHTS